MTMIVGGITRQVLTGRSASALQQYRDSVAEGQEGALLMTTRHCSLDLERQIAEWRAVREEHGTQGALRPARAHYETVDPDTGLHATGRRGTHIRERDSHGRWRQRPVRTGEQPTHLRIEANEALPVKQSEATHTIYAASAAVVNAENPDDILRFWELVNAERDALYPGLQESRWLERNGASGLVHIHVASNATVYRDFTLDGVDYRAGRKMAKALTSVDAVRSRADAFMDAHPELGLQQSLARVGSPEYAAQQLRDGQLSYWTKQRNGQSRQDQIREAIAFGLQDSSVTDHNSFVLAMRAQGIEARESGLRRGVPGKNHDYTFRRIGVDDRGVRGRTLGSAFTHAALGQRIQQQQQGVELPPLIQTQHGDPARPLPLVNPDGGPLTPQQQQELVALHAEIRSRVHAHQVPKTIAAVSPPAAIPPVISPPAQVAVEPLATGHRLSAATPQRQQRQPLSTEPSTPVSADSVHHATTGPSPQAGYRSALRTKHSKDPALEQQRTALVALDEQWYRKPPVSPEQRQKFAEQANRISLTEKQRQAVQPHMDAGVFRRFDEQQQQRERRQGPQSEAQRLIAAARRSQIQARDSRKERDHDIGLNL